MDRSTLYAALFAALIAALSFLPKFFVLPGVPITAQTLGVMLAGCILGARLGALACLLFLLTILIGLVPSSSGASGPAAFVSPTAGFLVGFPLAAFISGLIVEKWPSAPLLLSAGTAAVIGAIGALYLCGIAGLVLVTGKPFSSMASAVLVFVPGDLIKALLAALITNYLWRMRPAAVISRAAA